MPQVKKGDKYMSTVKIGPKGQIVIPKDVREMFGLSPGDTMMLLADAQRGIALERYEVFSHVADAIFSGKGKELYPQHSEQDKREFAKVVKQLGEEDT